MDKNFEFSKMSNDDLLELYKKADEYIAFLNKEKEKYEKGTDEK